MRPLTAAGVKQPRREADRRMRPLTAAGVKPAAWEADPACVS
jgi:hypothetical protein